MKIIGIFILLFFSNVVFTQRDTNSLMRAFGVSLNTSICKYSYDFPTTLSLVYRIKNHQLELGPKFEFFGNKGYIRNIGIEFNYRYYPNGIDKKFSMFFLVNSDFYIKKRISEYESYSDNPDYMGIIQQKTTRKYYTQNLGYGIQMNISRNLFLGSNVGIGLITQHYDSRSSSSNVYLNSKAAYVKTELGFIGALSLGYRFK